MSDAHGHDAWHQHSTAEGMPQHEHGAHASAKALGLTFITMVVGVIVVILILVPIFAPVVKTVGLDPVLVGTIITLQVAIGSATPPFGCDIFTAIAIFKRPYIEVIRGIFPFTVILLTVSVALIYFPQIALFLRDLAFR